jgi:hypothetical protein
MKEKWEYRQWKTKHYKLMHYINSTHQSYFWNLTVAHLLHFMEPQNPLPYSQQPSSVPCPQADESLKFNIVT